MDELNSLSNQIQSVSLHQPLKISSHCQLKSGDILGSYIVEEKLGTGRLSTVWSAKNQYNGGSVAIKVYRIGHTNSKYYENEVKILNTIFEYSFATQTVPPNIIGYLGTFAHVTVGHDKGPRIHPCVIFNNGGENLQKFIKYCRKQFDSAIPIPIVKKVMRELLTALAYLHKCGIIHTDIKPENILMNKRVSELDENGFSISLTDLGTSTLSDELFSKHPGTIQYTAPEIIIDMSYTTSADIWSAFVLCFELITGDLIFDVYGECEITYGEDVDEESSEGHLSNNTESMDVINTTSEPIMSVSSDSSGDEVDDWEKINYRHLLLIAKVLGYPPREFTRNARVYYNRHDRLKNNPDITPITIFDLLLSNYDLAEKDCLEIQDFLLTGLKYIPEERITAEQVLLHPWLNS